MNIRFFAVAVLPFLLLGACQKRDVESVGAGGGGLKCAVARIAASSADLVPGQVARGTLGDFVIENNRLRAIVQKGGRNWYNISEFGGNLIDALPKNSSGALLGRDNFEEFVFGTNIESAPNYQTVTVVNPGGEKPDGSCAPAILRAGGAAGAGAPDDLLDFVNGSTAIRDLGLFFPPGADDVDLPLTIQTDYTLEAGKNYIKIDSTLINETASAVDLYLVEYMNGSGEVEVFQHGYGFGEAFATAPCDRCNYIAYAGHEGGAGVSYGLIHAMAGTSSVSVSGVTVPLYGRDILLVAATPEDLQADSPIAGPNFTVPANGELTVTRYFAVGDGTVSSIIDARNAIYSVPAGLIEGLVTDANGPVAGAEIVMISAGRDGFPQGRGPVTNVVNHFRTDAQGRYRGGYPAGSYTLRLNMPGRLAPTPATAAITVTNDQTTTQNFTLPRASSLRVLVKDAAGNSIPAKVQVVGAPLGPDGGEPLNGETLPGDLLVIKSGFYGDPAADPLPPGIALAEFAVRDSGSGAVAVGDTGPLLLEPGSYQLSVSHGPRYSHFSQPITIVEGETATINAVLAEVMPTPNHIYGDFHVHSINSPDSEVTNRERVATYLAEDMDFFTPSDHDMRVDFAPVVENMGVGSRIATAPSAEVTTFDYGHYNFWPVAIETDAPSADFPPLNPEGRSSDAKVARGSIDWGGPAPLGKDFPSQGNYSLPPEEIFAAAAADPWETGRAVVRQINHIDWHFGVAAGGLRINTGVSPPQSTVAAGERRLDPRISNFYSDHYDTLELLIGTDGLEYQDDIFYNQNLGDWFNLLNQGKFHTGISNSDTHQRRVTSLHTRNVISVAGDLLLPGGKINTTAVSSHPHDVGDSVRAGYSTMTSAPFMLVKASKGANTAGLEVSDSFGRVSNPLPAADGAVNVQITVKSPIWAPYDQILVFVNGETARHTDELGIASNPARYNLCGPSHELNLSTADFTRTEATIVAANPAAKRYETTVSVPVSHPGSDFWIVVMVRGTGGNSPSMFPVVPNSFAPGADSLAGTADDIGIRALAVSNPIYVDVNGDGDWDAPGVLTHIGQPTPPAAPIPDECDSPMPAP